MPDTTQSRPGGVAPFGTDGPEVSRIGLGAMQLGGLFGMTPPPEDAAIAVLRRAVELGINHIDTAQFYGFARANELIRRALRVGGSYPADLVIVSKVGTVRTEQGVRAAQRPEELRAQVEANLQTLGIERLHAVNLRRMDERSSVRAEREQVVDLDSQLAELVALRSAGKIGAIGLSTVSLEQLQRGLHSEIACVQNPYNVLDRSDEPLFDTCREHGLAWVPYFPLGSALPEFAKVLEAPVVIETAAALGVTPAQVALAWLLAHGPNVLLIPGTSQVAHLEQNVAAGDVHLGADQMAALDALAAAPR